MELASIIIEEPTTNHGLVICPSSGSGMNTAIVLWRIQNEIMDHKVPYLMRWPSHMMNMDRKKL